MGAGEGRRWAEQPSRTQLRVLPGSHLEPPVPGWSPLRGARAPAPPAPGTAPPAFGARPGSLAGAQGASTPSTRAHTPAPAARGGGAAGGAGLLPTLRSGRVQPSPLPAAAKPPAPRPRRSLPGAPAQPGPRGHCSGAAGRAQRLGVQPAAAERPPSTMAVQAPPAQSRRAAHSAASETPAGAPAISGQFGVSVPPLPGGWLGWAPPALPRFTSWLLRGIRAEPQRQRLAACARRPGCRAGGARTLTAARAPFAPARAPPFQPVTSSPPPAPPPPPAAAGRGRPARVTAQPRSRHAPRPMRGRGGATWPRAFKGPAEHVGRGASRDTWAAALARGTF